MENVTNIEAFKHKANAPDEEQTYVDEGGVKWFKYGVDYKDQRGARMSFYIWATSLEDANERLESIKANACVYGQIISENE